MSPNKNERVKPVVRLREGSGQTVELSLGGLFFVPFKIKD